jgi:hypothetical protein
MGIVFIIASSDTGGPFIWQKVYPINLACLLTYTHTHTQVHLVSRWRNHRPCNHACMHACMTFLYILEINNNNNTYIWEGNKINIRAIHNPSTRTHTTKDEMTCAKYPRQISHWHTHDIPAIFFMLSLCEVVVVCICFFTAMFLIRFYKRGNPVWPRVTLTRYFHERFMVIQ